MSQLYRTYKGWLSAAAGAAVVSGMLLTATASAQSDSTLEVNVADCVAIESPAERFRCYESRVDAALREQVGDAAPAESADAAEAAVPPPPVEAAPAPRTEAAAEASRSAAEQRGSPVVPAGEIEIDDAAAAAEEFGLRRSRVAEQQGEAEELLGTVAALRQTVPNSYIITLENGQVWRQMRPQWYPLQVGHSVRIYPTRWGNSYRMTALELNGFIQVERVQ